MDSRKTLRYEEHAVRRMRRRGVTEEQVELAIRSPDRTRGARRPGAKKIEKQISKNRTVVVIIEEHPRFVRVVSAWMKR